jgi:hypothetical protein
MSGKFELLSGRTPMDLGRKVSKRLSEGWQLHGNTWSTGQGTSLEFHQAVIKKPTVIGKDK